MIKRKNIFKIITFLLISLLSAGTVLLLGVLFENTAMPKTARAYTSDSKYEFILDESDLEFTENGTRLNRVNPKVAFEITQMASSNHFVDVKLIIPSSVTKIGYDNENDDFNRGLAYNILQELFEPDNYVNMHLEFESGSSNIVEITDNCFKYITIASGLDKLFTKSNHTLAVIGKNAFKNAINMNSNFKNLVIPYNVRKIDEYAFCGCEDLTSLDFYDNVQLKEIGAYAFAQCKNLSKITWDPYGFMERIGSHAFLECYKLSELTLPKKLQTIGEYAFACSGISEVTIPETVKDIMTGAFARCSLTQVEFKDAVKIHGTDETDNILSPSYSNVHGAFEYCRNLKRVIFPTDETKFVEIGDATFKNTGLSNITLQSNVTTINKEVFSGTAFTDFTFPVGVTEIRDGAFSNCQQLKTLHLPEGVTELSPYVLSGSGIVDIDISRIEKIGKGAFSKCKNLHTIDIPAAVTILADEAFSGSGLTEIVIPENITELGASVFEGCTSLDSIHLPGSVASLGASAFKDCTILNDIHISTGIDSLESSLFEGCIGLCEIEIPQNINKIMDTVFKGCTNLDNVIIPSSVSEIYNSVFSGCTALTTIEMSNNITSDDTFGTNIFDGCTLLETVNIPNSGITKLPQNMFRNCEALQQITIPSNIATVDKHAFQTCTNLHEITFEEGTQTIVEEAFIDCTSLDKINFSSTLIEIQKNAFKGCINLTHLELPENLKYLNGFQNCSGLIEVTISDSVTDMQNAFSGCTSLQTVNINPTSKLEYMGSAFSNCTQLEKIFIPDSVTNIQSAFSGCSNLQTVNINQTSHLENVNSAFSNCTQLEKIFIPDSASDLRYAFTYCTNLKYVIMNETHPQIKNFIAAFRGCTSLISLYVPNYNQIYGSSGGGDAPQTWEIPETVKAVIVDKKEQADEMRQFLNYQDRHNYNVTYLMDIEFKKDSSSSVTQKNIYHFPAGSIDENNCLIENPTFSLPNQDEHVTWYTEEGKFGDEALTVESLNNYLTTLEGTPKIVYFYGRRSFDDIDIQQEWTTHTFINAHLSPSITPYFSPNDTSIVFHKDSIDGEIVRDPINIGVYYMTISQREYGAPAMHFTGSKTFRFEITPADLNDAEIYYPNLTWNGQEQRPKVTVRFKDGYSYGNYLTLDKDYTITYDGDLLNVGTNQASFTISSNSPNIIGSKTVTFSIAKHSISNGIKLTLENETYTFTGSEIKPNVTVTINYNGVNIPISSSDYTIEYKNNINVSWHISTGYDWAIITIKASEDNPHFRGSFDYQFNIEPANINDVTLFGMDDLQWNGLEQKPEPTFKLGDYTLVKDTDYTFEFSEDDEFVEVGTKHLTITVLDSGNFTGISRVMEFEMGKRDISNAKIELWNSYLSYDGIEKRPNVSSVKIYLDNNVTLTLDRADFDVSYENNINAIDYSQPEESRLLPTVIVTASLESKNFTGTARTTFYISQQQQNVLLTALGFGVGPDMFFNIYTALRNMNQTPHPVALYGNDTLTIVYKDARNHEYAFDKLRNAPNGIYYIIAKVSETTNYMGFYYCRAFELKNGQFVRGVRQDGSTADEAEGAYWYDDQLNSTPQYYPYDKPETGDSGGGTGGTGGNIGDHNNNNNYGDNRTHGDGGGNKIAILLIVAGGVVVVATIVTIVLVKRKKKHSKK